MLERLFISKVRVKIIKHFVLHPNEVFHIRELTRILDEEVNAVRRELKNLEAFGLIVCKKQVNKLRCHLNPNCTSAHDLKSMILKDSEDLKLMAKVLGAIGKIDTVIITQAYLSQKYEDENDVDILIIGKPDINKLNKEMDSVEKELGRELRMAVLTQEDYEFRKKRREKFILDIIERDKIVLLGSPNKIGL